MSEITEYKDYVSQDLELSDEQLDEKWGVGVLIVNKKLDKMGEQLKQALIDAKTPSIEAANIDNDPKMKNASKEKKQAMAKKKEQLAKAKEQATQSMIDQMNTLCRETGLGKGANDPRCISHCKYVISKAQKEAISEILKKNEDILDKETKKSLEELEKKREEQEKKGKELEGKPVDKIPQTKEEIEQSNPELASDDKKFKEMYDEAGEEEDSQGNKVKVFTQKYVDPEEYIKKHPDEYKDKFPVILDEADEPIDKKKIWPTGIFSFVDGKCKEAWYSGTICMLPCPDRAKVLEKSSDIAQFFKSCKSVDDVFKKYEALKDEQKKTLYYFFKYVQLSNCAKDAKNVDKSIYDKVTEDDIKDIFKDTSSLFEDKFLTNAAGGEKILQKITSGKGGDKEDGSEEIVEEYKKNKDKAEEFIDKEFEKINKAAKNKKGKKKAMKSLIDFANALVSDKSKELKDKIKELWNKILPKHKVDSFDNIEVKESIELDGVLKFSDWLLEKEEKKEALSDEDKESIKKLVKDYFDTIEDVTEEDKENLDKFIEEIDNPSEEDEKDSSKEVKVVNKKEVKDASAVIDDLG